MNSLFDDDALGIERPALPDGAVHVPGWLTREQQRWLADQFRRWAAGPVPPHSPMVGAHPMSVQTVCLGWHWRPYTYSREAVDVNGRRVLAMPESMVRLGRLALGAADHPQAAEYTPDTLVAHFYDRTAKMGMHQDRDERSAAPVVSLSIGDTARFRFGNTAHRGQPYQDLDLQSGDLFVFGGPSRLAFHGVQKIYAGTAPHDCGLAAGRLNLTLRVTGLADDPVGKTHGF
ncbi:alpha-ketoglutarate-dependent dioxygenase AlkB family protein [Gordonia hydrophobica]|uniref:Alpha-ketoglutarate-dependent dioxygenase AlkB n=1 Tax=Gordonia hydrophobica TaxID=40516 RepID=A0ABZ2U283_9ACTN|nr:alpha-ketoglutarate-dependent dioxygenase AlkB [Gordonia hydrophobica]MBM7368485.1 alkylated DNA repair protein (DNA oxidative demethylase) [Gordonia hydrophobica]